MLEIVVPQLRFAYSMLTGRPFDLGSLDRIVDAMLATRDEFGFIGAEGAEVIRGPTLDEGTRRDMQLRRFRTQATRGARETTYYGSLFAALGLDPARLTAGDVARIPPTPKQAVKDAPGAFVRRGARVAFRTTTTGTTGKPTSTFFSAHEIAVIAALNAMTFIQRGHITARDIVQVCTSSRATLGNTCFTRACERIGAVWYQAGLVDPDHALALLREEHALPGKKPHASMLDVYPSYLGALVEHGLAAGYGPADFGLEHVSVGGEVVTAGLRTRCRRLFGEVVFIEGYAMTETWPFGGTRCEQGHLHFEAAHGLLEVLSVATGAPASPGELGTIVATPFPPFRDASVVLRYDTGDLVRALEGPLTCSLRHVPATSDVEGRLHLAVRHPGGWTTPRDVMEALESVEVVPLPARFGLWAEDGGVAVEVVARGDPSAARRQVGDALERRGVPVRRLDVCRDRDELQQPYLLRGDLREALFGRT